MKIGDKVLIKAEIVGITEADNPIIKTEGGIKMLVKKSDMAEEDNTTSWEYEEITGLYICKKCGMSELWDAIFCPSCGRKAVSE